MESNERRINAVMPLVNLDGRTYTGCVDKGLWAFVNPPSLLCRDRGGYE